MQSRFGRAYTGNLAWPFLLRVPRDRGFSGAILGRRRSFDCRPRPASFLTHCLGYSALGDERTAQRATELITHLPSNEAERDSQELASLSASLRVSF